MAITRIAAPLRQQVIASLRTDITSFEFEPGERLFERSLCDRYEVSRTVVREALRQLEAEGIVTMVPNRGPVVAQVTPEEASALFEVRSALEPMVVKLFAERATREQKAQLTAAVRTFEKSLASGLLADELNAKDNYYEVLLEGCGNPVMGSLFRTLQTRTRMLRGLSLGKPGRGQQSVRELKAVGKAINSGDLDLAWSLGEKHVRNAATTALARLAEERTPDTPNFTG